MFSILVWTIGVVAYIGIMIACFEGDYSKDQKRAIMSLLWPIWGLLLFLTGLVGTVNDAVEIVTCVFGIDIRENRIYQYIKNHS